MSARTADRASPATSVQQSARRPVRALPQATSFTALPVAQEAAGDRSCLCVEEPIWLVSLPIRSSVLSQIIAQFIRVEAFLTPRLFRDDSPTFPALLLFPFLSPSLVEAPSPSPSPSPFSFSFSSASLSLPPSLSASRPLNPANVRLLYRSFAASHFEPCFSRVSPAELAAATKLYLVGSPQPLLPLPLAARLAAVLEASPEPSAHLPALRELLSAQLSPD